MKTTIIIFSIFALIFFSCLEGPTGPQGPQGEKGEKGDTGEPCIIEPSEQLHITIVSGNNRVMRIDKSLGLQVRINDGYGQPVYKTRIDWEIIKGTGSLPSESTLTSSEGQSNINLRSGNKIGEIQVKATVFGSGGYVVFSVFVIEVGDITIVSGNNQTGIVGKYFPEKIVVMATDTEGIPREGIQVHFQVFTNSEYDWGIGIYTDSEGKAYFNPQITKAGQVEIKATLIDIKKSVLFNLTAVEE